MAPFVLPAPSPRTALFNKPYDGSLLDAVSGTSGFETARFAKLAGVTFYKVANLGKVYGCPFTATLPSAHAAIEKEFHDHESDIQKKSPNSVLEGFYLDRDMVTEITRMNSGPLIAVKNDSERYVMVHELMHHVFQLSKDKSGQQYQLDYSISGSLYVKAKDRYDQSSSTDGLKDVVSKFSKVSNDLITVLRNYPLEEMANENELNTKYQAGDLRYVNKFSRHSGDHYIVSSAESAKDRLEVFVDELSALKKEAANKIDVSSPDKAIVDEQLNEVARLFESVRHDIDVNQGTAQMRIYRFHNEQGVASGLVFNGEAHEEVTADCSHSHGVDKLLKDMEKKIFKTK